MSVNSCFRPMQLVQLLVLGAIHLAAGILLATVPMAETETLRFVCHFLPLDLPFDLPALFNAAAMACFRGCPEASISLIFSPITARLLPFLSGMEIVSSPYILSPPRLPDHPTMNPLREAHQCPPLLPILRDALRRVRH